MQLDHPTGELLDDDALQRAFDAAQQSIDESAEYTQQVGSDGRLENTGEGRPGSHDADELAWTAGELLDNVKHDQNPKFQKSSFLSLMRQLRDREVHVEGDKIINVST